MFGLLLRPLDMPLLVLRPHGCAADRCSWKATLGDGFGGAYIDTLRSRNALDAAKAFCGTVCISGARKRSVISRAVQSFAEIELNIGTSHHVFFVVYESHIDNNEAGWLVPKIDVFDCPECTFDTSRGVELNGAASRRVRRCKGPAGRLSSRRARTSTRHCRLV